MQKITAHLQGTKKRILKFISTVTVLCLLCLLPVSYAWAKTYHILILSSGNSPVYSQIINTIQNTVSSNTGLSNTDIDTKFSIIYLQTQATREGLKNQIKNQDLIVTIGQRAMIAATNINDAPPIIASLIPKQSYEKSRQALHKAGGDVTAVFIDNPPERQILLAKILLGKLQRLAVLIGENSPYNAEEIKTTIRKLGLESHLKNLKESDNLIRTLSHTLEDSDAFLALPDAQIFNRGTAKNILLTTYRQHTPVIAYSASYVKAGALAAVYSTPQQIAKQTGKVLLLILQSQLQFPAHDTYPEDFKIAINRNVAKSLGVPVPSETIIKNKLVNALGKEQ